MAQRLRRADIRDLDEVRRILEVAIVERAAGRRTEQDIEKIERFLAERGATAAAGRLEACIEADIRFHVALAEATHNEILYELYRSATIHLQKVSNTFTSIRAIFSHRSLRTNGWYGI